MLPDLCQYLALTSFLFFCQDDRYVKHWFSARSNFILIWQWLQTFLIVTTDKSTAIQWVKARDATIHPTEHKRASTSRDYLPQVPVMQYRESLLWSDSLLFWLDLTDHQWFLAFLFVGFVVSMSINFLSIVCSFFFFYTGVTVLFLICSSVYVTVINGLMLLIPCKF